jgi:hypothetical protein
MSTITPSSMAELVLLLQTAYPRTWEQLFRNFFGDSVPVDLPPAELARFTDHVFWSVKQAGIKDPADWLAFRRAQEEKEAAMALAAAIEWEALIDTGSETVATHGSAETSASASPPAEHERSTVASATAALSPSEIAKDKIAIGGDLYVSFAYLASMLGISERTLARRTANSNDPPAMASR